MGRPADGKCPECGTPQAEGAVVCIACGYDSRTGEVIKVTIERDAPRPEPATDPNAILCPRCGRTIRRAVDREGQGTGFDEDELDLDYDPILGPIFKGLASVVCPMCGMIARKEFPPHIARRLLLQSIALVLAPFIVIGVIVAIVLLVMALCGS